MLFVTLLLCKLVSCMLQIFHMGSSLPGKLALRLRKNMIAELSRFWRVVLVTGTNGKTTTTAMLYNMLLAAGISAVTNTEGANMSGGIAAALIKGKPLFCKPKPGGIAVLEVDEAYMRTVAPACKPEMIIVTNVFKDQLDRFG
ncbi:MAG: DUF1727 domain-containing protein, partial [Oscillospiraceae bacterium]|nr:DUF1727 domain-containing protein [Oscillospiraceae bacterium]